MNQVLDLYNTSYSKADVLGCVPQLKNRASYGRSISSLVTGSSAEYKALVLESVKVLEKLVVKYGSVQ